MRILCPASHRLAIILFLSVIIMQDLSAQPELEAWGNLAGIRIDGQLMEFETSLRIIGKDWAPLNATGKERQRPHFTTEGNNQIVTTRLDSINFKEQVEDLGHGMAGIKVQMMPVGSMTIKGAFLSILLPGSDYHGGRMEWIEPSAVPLDKILPDGDEVIPGSDRTLPGSPHEYFRAPAMGIRMIGPHRQLEIRTTEPGLIIGVAEGENIRLWLPIHLGDAQKGQDTTCAFTIKATGDIDRAPIHLSLNTHETGRPFDGFGGNFRLQNAALDPEVIDYCLQNMRVAWGRVELPWRFWQPAEDSRPLDSARAGKLNPAVQKAMEMADTLHRKGIPFILSCWFPPDWAVDGPLRFRPGPGIPRGNPLNKDRMQAIYQSITDYILFLKERYGAEPRLFSFNESDLGINVRQTGEEHDALIKGLGAFFQAHGLHTKMILGDNSDATTFSFIEPAMHDPAARPFIGAVDFHSWRGWDSATLQKWASAATTLHLPLIVAEGSIDAAAYSYPAIFAEPIYALREINLYIRLLSICQPLSILQWQLTSDYSPLAGGGLYGDKSPLRPTWRFWNLEQLASTPAGLSAMPVSCDRPDISCAALGDNRKNSFAIHLVNLGATRAVTLDGLPKKLRQLLVYTTNQQETMKAGDPIPVHDGEAHFTIEAVSFVTLQSTN